MTDHVPITTLPLTDRSAVTKVRSRVAAICTEHGVDPDELPLAAHELAVNAVIHGKAPAVLTVSTRPGRLVVRVTDALLCELPDEDPPLDEESESRRGLVLVRALSAFSWGIAGDRKYTEAAVRLPRPDRQP